MEVEGDNAWFLLLTHLFVVSLASMQAVLCFQAEWGGGFSLSDFASVHFFNLHPLLNILAFGVAMTESLICYKGFNFPRRTAKTLHAILQLLSVLLGAAAFVVVLIFHNTNKFPNFYSVHSWIGLSVYILAWTQFIASVFIFWLPGLAPGSLKVAYLRCHKISGLAIYSAAMAAVATGLMQKQSFLRNSTPKAPLFGTANLLSNAISLLAVFTSVGVLGALGFGRASGSRNFRASVVENAGAAPEAPMLLLASTTSSGALRTRTPTSHRR